MRPAVRCVVIAESSGPALIIRGRIVTDREIAGRYTLTASRTGGGTSKATQSGDFRATPDSPAWVGNIMLGGSGKTSATLTVSAGDQTTSCRLE